MDIKQLIKQENFRDNYHKAMINLFYTSNFFRDAHVHIFKKYKIQGQHFNVLRILKGKHPEPVSPGYIKEVILDKGRDLTRLIDKLVELKWVSRKICEDNKRRMNINLTAKGLEVVEKITNELVMVDQKIKHLSEEEYEQLSNLLDKMRG
jgi:DNA-binding MarR family transcriptional regulator